jgi:hypothetical protein
MVEWRAFLRIRNGREEGSMWSENDLSIIIEDSGEKSGNARMRDKGRLETGTGLSPLEWGFIYVKW